MYGSHPVLIITDMLPGATDERDAPGLTLGYIPMPCLSIVIWRSQIVFRTRYTHAGGTRTLDILVPQGISANAHSPELPLLTSSIQSSVDITRTILFDNEPHRASTAPNATLCTLPCGRVYPSCAFYALSDLSHYQPD